MNHIVSAQRSALPAAQAPIGIPPSFTMPLLPTELRLAVGHYIDPTCSLPPDQVAHGAGGGRSASTAGFGARPNPVMRMARVVPIGEDARSVAKQVLRMLEPLLRPAGREVFDDWLAGVAAAFRFPLSENDFDEKLESCGLLIDDMPVVAFTRDTQRRLLRDHPKAIPGAGDMAAILEAAAQPVRATVEALRALLDYVPPARTEPVHQDPEERERVRDGLRNLVLELGGTPKAAGGAPAVGSGRSGVPHWAGALGGAVREAAAARSEARR